NPGIVDCRLGTSPERGPRPFELRLRECGLLTGLLVHVVLQDHSGNLLAGEGLGLEELVQPSPVSHASCPGSACFALRAWPGGRRVSSPAQLDPRRAESPA